VDQLADEYAGSPIYFLEYPVDSAPSNRSSRWWAAYTEGGSVYLPLVMLDSGIQISNGPVDFYNVYKPMVDAALARPAQAAITSYILRCGNKLRFFMRLTNHSGVSLLNSTNNAAVHAIVWEDTHVADTNRYVRASVSANITSVLADGTSATFVLETPELTGVDWDKLHAAALADYRPAGLIGPYDMLQAAAAPRAGILRDDFDADGMQDITVFRPGDGVWYMLTSSNPGSYRSTQWGLPSDLPLAGDYDGDGMTDIAVWRPESGTWFILRSSQPGNYLITQWGISTDIPVAGDYDGDGMTDIAVWRPSEGMWYILPSNSPGTYSANQWGFISDIPVPADYDGDGKTDLAVWRPDSGTWFVLPSNSPGSYTSDQWGVNTDIPTPGDYDADAKTDIAVWRSSEGVWYVLPSASPGSYTSTQWGTTTDTPATGDYDGDGKADIAVWRPDDGVWYIMPSGSPGSYTATQWGAVGDGAISGLTGILRSIR
jgi:hypothetical protein